MKQILVQLLQEITKRLALLTLWRYRPGVVGITGNVGKTSAKLAIATILSGDRKVRWSKGNLNNELGLPLTILGDWSEEDLSLVSRHTPAGERQLAKVYFWLKVLLLSSYRIIAKDSEYPDILVLEYGADRPGDLRYLLSIARPNVSVITAVGEIPVHVEFYPGGPQELAREKARIIECLPSSGFAVLNHDDETVMNLSERTRAHVMTYGSLKDANLHIVNFENKIEGGRPVGISFKLEYGGHSVPVKINGAFGKAQAYAAASAASVGIVFGINLVKISEALQKYEPASQRMEVLPGIKDTWIINDCYNASLMAMQSALETMKSFPAKRKVAILGDMLEIGKYTVEAHERVGRIAAKVADVLVTIGPRAKFIAEAAKQDGMKKAAVKSFDSGEEAKAAVQDLVKKGDLILIKASRGMHLETIVDEIRAYPEMVPEEGGENI